MRTICGYTKIRSSGYEIGTPGNDPGPEKTAVEDSGNLKNRARRADRAERAAGTAAAEPTADRAARAVNRPKPEKINTWGRHMLSSGSRKRNLSGEETTTSTENKKKKQTPLARTLSNLDDRVKWGKRYQDGTVEKLLGRNGVVRTPSGRRLRSGTVWGNPEPPKVGRENTNDEEQTTTTNTDKDPGDRSAEGANMSQTNGEVPDEGGGEVTDIASLVVLFKKAEERQARNEKANEEVRQSVAKLVGGFEQLGNKIDNKVEIALTKVKHVEKGLTEVWHTTKRHDNRISQVENATRNMQNRMEQMEDRIANGRREQEYGKHKESHDAEARRKQYILKYVPTRPFDRDPNGKKAMRESDKQATVDFLKKGMPELAEHEKGGAKDQITGSSLESAIESCVRFNGRGNNKVMKVTFHTQRDRDIVAGMYSSLYRERNQEIINEWYKTSRENKSKGLDAPRDYTEDGIFAIEDCHSQEVKKRLRELHDRAWKANKMRTEEEPKFTVSVRDLEIVQWSEKNGKEQFHRTQKRCETLVREHEKYYANNGRKRKERSPRKNWNSPSNGDHNSSNDSDIFFMGRSTPKRMRSGFSMEDTAGRRGYVHQGRYAPSRGGGWDSRGATANPGGGKGDYTRDREGSPGSYGNK